MTPPSPPEAPKTVSPEENQGPLTAEGLDRSGGWTIRTLLEWSGDYLKKKIPPLAV